MISKYLLLLHTLFMYVCSDTLHAVTSNTGTGLDTTMPDGCDSESKYFEYASGLKSYTYLSVSNTVGGLRVYAQDGTLLAQISTVANHKMSLQVKDPMKIFYSNYLGDARRFSITVSGSTYALIQDQSKLTNFYTLASYSETSSTYVYLCGSQDLRRNRKMDMMNLNTSPTAGSFVSGQGWTRSIKLLTASSPNFLVGGDYTFHLIIDKASMQEVTRFNNYISGLFFQGRMNQINNLNSNHLYVGNEATSLFLVDISLVQSGTMSISFLAVPLTVSDVVGCSATNMGTLQYLALHDKDMVAFRLVNKTTFTFEKTTIFQDLHACHFASLVGFVEVSNKMYFSRLEITNKNFQSYYLVFDNCTYRLETEVCIACLPGFYRNTTLPGGDCILPQHFLPKHGIDDPNILMSHCLTGCLACLMDYQICTLCDAANGYYLHSNGTCLTVPMMPAGFGANLTSGLVSACTSTGCLLCAADNTKCTSCNMVGGYYLLGTSCVTVPGIPAGQGANTVTGVVVPCNPAGCLLCAANYQTCTSCNTSSNYYLLSPNCLQPASFPPATGINSIAGTVVACQDTHCTSCISSYLICTECDYGSGWFLHGTSCITYSGMPPSYGPNLATGVVTTCQSTGCITCKNNYQTCTACNTALNYTLNGTTCISVTSITPGMGLNTSSNTIEPCVVSHCIDCQVDITTCSSCNVSNGYYLYSGTCITSGMITGSNGINLVEGIVEPCEDVNCLDCRANYSVCIECDTSNDYYLHANSCVTFANMPAGKGPNLSTGIVVDCSSTGCIECKNNYIVCTSCDYVGGYTRSGSACTLISTLPSGFGVDTSTNTKVSCQDTHCLDCRTDYAVCTACDTASSYYLLSPNCIQPTSFPPSKGIDHSTGTVVSCTDIHCVNCQINHTICDICDYASGWFLHGSSCITYASMPVSKGPDAVSGKVVGCSSIGCLLCKNDYQVCTLCDTTTGYYLTGTTCIHHTAIADGSGANLVTGTVVACQDSNCIKCQSNFALCNKCMPMSGYVLEANSCVLPSSLVPGRGADTDQEIARPCLASNCVDCRQDFQECTQCAATYYLFGLQCIQAADSPKGYGPDDATQTIVRCTDSHCATCQGQYTTCTVCDEIAGYFMSGSTCIPVSSIQAGQGIDRINGGTKPCLVNNCAICYSDYTVCRQCMSSGIIYYLDDNTCKILRDIDVGYGYDPMTYGKSKCRSSMCTDCVYDYSVCKACDESKGYYLNVDKCTSINQQVYKYTLVPITNPNKQEHVDMTWLVYVVDSILDTYMYSIVYNHLQVHINTTLQLYDVHTPIDVKYRLVSKNIGMYILCYVTLDHLPSVHTSTVQVNNLHVSNYSSDDMSIQFIGFTYNFTYTSRYVKKDVETEEFKADVLNTAMGSGGKSTNNKWLQVIIIAVLALDPTGVLIRFSQILKIVNRLYFININYGMRLGSFLSRIGDPLLTIDDHDRVLHNVYNSKNYRGKLTKKNVPLDFISSFYDKLPFYILSWLLKVVNAKVEGKVRKNSWYMYVLYFAPKVHLIIFNLVFIDFIWIAVRTMIHSKNFEFYRIATSYIVVYLLYKDIVDLLLTILDEYKWYKYYRSEVYTVNNDVKLLSTSTHVDRHVSIDTTSSIVKMLAINIKKDRHVIGSKACRSNTEVHILRCLLYQVILSTMQYTSGMCILLLYTVEVLKICHATYCYLKYKYLKNVICLLMEVSQSICMLLFLAICFILHYKRFDEVIKDFYQDAGIWIVIASCVAEYLLLLTYIGVAAYDFFKNRKNNKVSVVNNSNVHSNTSMPIQVRTADASPTKKYKGKKKYMKVNKNKFTTSNVRNRFVDVDAKPVYTSTKFKVRFDSKPLNSPTFKICK